MATEDADGDEVEDEDEDEEHHEAATEAVEAAEAATEDHETAKSPTKSNTLTTTMSPPPTVNRRTAMAPGQRPGEAASDHEVVSVVEAEAVEDEAVEAEDEVEAGVAPTKASLVTTRLRLRSKPKIKYIYATTSCLCPKKSTCLPLITLKH